MDAEPPPSPRPPARALLLRYRIEDLLLEQKPPVVIRGDSSVAAALRILASNHFLSAPVVVPESPDDASWVPNQGPQDILGFVDIRDILSSFLREVGLLEDLKLLQRMRVLEDAGAAFCAKPLRELPSLGGDGSFLCDAGVATRATIMELVHDGLLYPKETKAMHGGSRSRKLVHRVAIFSKAGLVTAILTQSDVVRLLAAHLDELGDLAATSAQQLGWAPKEVISVTPERPALEVLALLERHNISAVAVVAARGGTPRGGSPRCGRLMGNFSVSELRTILPEHFGSLALPVGEFLALEHGTEWWGRPDLTRDMEEAQDSRAYSFAARREARAAPGPGPEPKHGHEPCGPDAPPGFEINQPLVTCRPSDTFATIVQLLTQHHLHRLYVVDERRHPVGVVTLTDVLRAVVEAGQRGSP